MHTVRPRRSQNFPPRFGLYLRFPRDSAWLSGKPADRCGSRLEFPCAICPGVYAAVYMRAKVAATRLSEREWAQVAAAAGRLGESVSEFMREAALARVTGKVSEAERRDEDGPASMYADRGLVGLEPVRHMVDGEWTGRYLP
jgi:hypothetical protein